MSGSRLNSFLLKCRYHTPSKGDLKELNLKDTESYKLEIHCQHESDHNGIMPPVNAFHTLVILELNLIIRTTAVSGNFVFVYRDDDSSAPISMPSPWMRGSPSMSNHESAPTVSAPASMQGEPGRR